MNNKVLYGIIAVLVGFAIWQEIQSMVANKTIKDLEFSNRVLMEGRVEELKIEREIAKKKVKDIQVVVDSIYKADSVDKVKYKKAIGYYERKIKQMQEVNTYIGIDHITDSILRANGKRQ